MHTGIPISSISPDEQYVNLDVLIINLENATPILYSMTNNTTDFTQVENLKKLLDYALHLKALLNESKTNFENLSPKLKELVDFYNQNKAIQEPNHIQITEMPILKETPSQNNTLRPISSVSSQNRLKINEKADIKMGASKRSNPAQKTSSSSQNEKPSQQSSKSVRSDRSFRTIEKNLQPQTSHPLDIWLRSKSIFSPLPSAEDINLVCKPIDQDQLTVPPHARKHWVDTLADAVRNTPRENKKQKNNQIMMPPSKPPPDNAISDYWKKRQPPFQVEGPQKQNRSVIHYLLSAFVEAKPLPPDHPFNSIPQDDIIPMHVLLPQLKYHDYLCHPFEDRLEYELQLAGLRDPEEDEEPEENMFQDDIESYKKDIERYQKQIDAIKDEIIEKLPEYKHDEERRLMEAQEYGALLQIERDKEPKPGTKPK